MEWDSIRYLPIWVRMNEDRTGILANTDVPYLESNEHLDILSSFSKYTSNSFFGLPTS